MEFGSSWTASCRCRPPGLMCRIARLVPGGRSSARARNGLFGSHGARCSIGWGPSSFPIREPACAQPDFVMVPCHRGRSGGIRSLAQSAASAELRSSSALFRRGAQVTTDAYQQLCSRMLAPDSSEQVTKTCQRRPRTPRPSSRPPRTSLYAAMSLEVEVGPVEALGA